MGNAVYVWQSDIFQDREENLKKCRRYEVTDVFLSAYNLLAKAEEYRRLINRFDMRFYAMASTNEFSVRPDLALNYIDEVMRYNAYVEKEERFAGVHFDVEPHALPEYASKAEEVLISFGNMAKACHEKASLYRLEFGLSIPWWYAYALNNFESQESKEHCCSSFFQRLVGSADHLAIMAYLSEPERIVGSVKDILHHSDKKTFVSVDHIPLLKMIQDELAKAYSSIPHFQGIAIHHYEKL
jgi:hypothetical protein